MSSLSEEEYKRKLTPEQYRVLREKDTEPPFSGKLLDNHEQGSYHCAACGQTVFASKTKFDSGSGWPSFYSPEDKSVMLKEDSSHGMRRVEVCCSNCGSHLGHVFDDAYDQPTGQRFCINSAALDFTQEDKN